MRAGWFLKEGGWGARERDFQRLLKPISLVTFLFGDKKVTPANTIRRNRKGHLDEVPLLYSI